MAKKTWTRERVERELAKYLPGWTIQNPEWTPKNAGDKAPLLCPRGHEVDRVCFNIKSGYRCKQCDREDELKNAYEEFTSAAIAEGYEPLFTVEEYKDSHTKMPLRCPNGSIYQVSKGKFISSGRRCNCTTCRKGKWQTYNKWTHETASARLRELGEELLETFQSTQVPVLSRCIRCGYIRKIMPKDYFHAGRSCCEKCAGKYSPTTEEYREKLRAKGWCLAEGAEYVKHNVPIKHICPKGHHVMMSPNSWNNGNGCSECYREKLSERMRGEHNPNYNHNLTDEQRREREDARRSPEYWRWQKAVIARDAHSCVLCSSTEGVKAHHFYSFTNFRDLRYDVENGIALCDAHHMQGFPGSFHDIFGHDGGTVATQFIEYLEKHVKPGVDGVTEEGIRRAREMALNIIQKVEGARHFAGVIS